jgi:2-polyprenyl-3-methyl-5-hydroxy-6-metoxy-1,4-benzoquinol methylase
MCQKSLSKGEYLMDENTKIIRNYYDAIVEDEWKRIANRPEYLLTCRMLDRYIKPGDKVLDIGGGPGRYSLYLAQKGCNVTLLDLSAKNTRFAAERANEQGLSILTVPGDAREVDKLIEGQFDHILLMGPMYHLLEESDRIQSVNSAISLLKSNGVIFVSFINLFAGMIFYMRDFPDFTTDDDSDIYVKNVIEGKSYSGNAFTKAFFIDQREVLPFMKQFPLDKLHLFGQEGVSCPCEGNIMAQSQKVIDSWLDFCEAVWERDEFLSYSEHLMYVGRKM